MKLLHGDGSVLPWVAFPSDRRPTTPFGHVHKRGRGVAVSVRVGFGVKCFIGTDIADNSGALVGESCKGQSLPYIQDFLAVYSVAQERVACCVRGCAIRGGQRLRGDQRGAKEQFGRERASAGMSSSK